MARIDDLLQTALRGLAAKPEDSAGRPDKKRYSELVSEAVALAIADDLRNAGSKKLVQVHLESLVAQVLNVGWPAASGLKKLTLLGPPKKLDYY